MVTKKKSTQSPFADIKKGTLHRALGYKQSEKIPASDINKVASADVGEVVNVNGKNKKITLALKRKAVFAKSAKKFKH